MRFALLQASAGREQKSRVQEGLTVTIGEDHNEG